MTAMHDTLFVATDDPTLTDIAEARRARDPELGLSPAELDALLAESGIPSKRTKLQDSALDDDNPGEDWQRVVETDDDGYPVDHLNIRYAA